MAAVPGPVGTTAKAVGNPVPPGKSGVIPNLFKHTRLKISNLDSSVGLRFLRTAAAVSVAGVASCCSAATTLSQDCLEMKAMSRSLVGLPSPAIRLSCRFPFVPAQSATSARLPMAFNSASVGSIFPTWWGDGPLVQRRQARSPHR